jgi:hypothetical protein
MASPDCIRAAGNNAIADAPAVEKTDDGSSAG